MAAEFAFPPRKPVRRSDLIAALGDESRVRLTFPTAADVAGRVQLQMAIANAEWFDFGAIDIFYLERAARDFIPFLGAGLTRLPFPRCVFRMRGIGGVRPMEWVLVCEADGALPIVFLLAVFGDDCEMISVADRFDYRSNGFRSAADGEFTKAFFDMFAGLWIILNTKHIAVRTVEPAAALNRARINRGKMPLSRVTYVDAGQYITALKETERLERGISSPAGHASPRMHLRRAHLRRLGDQVVGVAATIVNARPGVALGREKYQVQPSALRETHG